MGFSSHVEWDFIGIVLSIFLAAVYGRIGRTAPFWQILCRLPGTALHESAHYLVAFMTGGGPAGFTIIPRRSGGGENWVLGSVTLRRPSAFSCLPTGLAPLLLLPFAWVAYRNWFLWFPRDPAHTLFLYAAICLCCCSSVPSAQDMRVALSSLAGVALYGAVAAALFCFLML